MTAAARTQLRHLFSVAVGATPDPGRAEYWDGTMLWATPGDLGSSEGYWLRDTRRKVTRAGHESCGATVMPPNSIVLTRRAPIGQLSVLARAACSNQDCFLLEPRDGADARYYYYWFSARADYLRVLANGQSSKALGTDELKSLMVPRPAPATQTVTADYLDGETARLDALVEEKERVVGLMAETREAIVVEAVTRGLDPGAPLRDSGVAWLGEIPSDWTTCRMTWLVRRRNDPGRAELPVLEVSIDSGVSVRSFSEAHVRRGPPDFDAYSTAREGDLLFSRTRMWQGAVGVAPQDGVVGPDVVVATPTGGLLPEYAKLLFSTEKFGAEGARRSPGVVRDRLRLGWTRFLDIQVPVPPIEVQQAIADHLVEAVGRVDALVALAQEAITLLRERRAALIEAAVGGGIDFGDAP